ncbi:hypothetical protein ACHAWX_003455 [Stephanocyclus meneghinianus]
MSDIGTKTTGSGSLVSEHFQGQRPPLSPADYDVLATLNTTCHRVLERHQLHMTAQITSLRQTTVSAIAIMFVLLVAGTTIFLAISHVSVAQALLFSVYTVTSAGYGNVPTPSTVGFLLFGVAYVYLGISALAINVAQVYQYLETEHNRRVYQEKKIALMHEGLSALQDLSTNSDPESEAQIVDERIRRGIALALSKVDAQPVSVKRRWRFLQVCGRIPPALSTPLFLIASLLIGAIAMILIEGWTFVEALYFATFSMTTVGYGDITPVSRAGTWFTVFWLPLNVPFLALYLGTVGHYFVRVSHWKEQSIERKMRRDAGRTTTTAHRNVPLSPCGTVESNGAQTHMPRAQDTNQNVRFASATKNPIDADALLHRSSSDPLDAVSSSTVMPSVPDGTPSTSLNLPVFNQNVSSQSSENPDAFIEGGTEWMNGFITVKDLVEQVNDVSRPWGGDDESRQRMRLRFAAMERLALIVVSIPSLPSHMDIKRNEFFITVDSFKEVVMKWKIPYAAREAFRIAMFQSLLFVGERDLVKLKMNAFWNMDPIHFNSLLGAVVLAMEGSVEEWLTITEPLAAESVVPGGGMSASSRATKRRVVKNQIEDYFPVNQGNAVLVQF